MTGTKTIFDIGAHCGNDAEFYLKKGFRVVSVEANPSFADEVLARNKKWADVGLLTVVNAAIANAEGAIEFHVHQHGDWSSIDKSERFVAGQFETISVVAITAKDLFDVYGTPYYVKVDIEGYDHLIIEEIARRPQRPKYVSYELGRQTRHCAELLAAAGYSKFALVPQSSLPSVRLPTEPAEGNYVDYRFTLHNSGPFGAEVQAPWGTVQQLAASIASLDHSSGLQKWWDVHAQLDAEYADSLVPHNASVQDRRKRVGWERTLSDAARKVEARATSDGSESVPLVSLVADVAKDWKSSPYYDGAEQSIDLQWKKLVWPCIKDLNFDVVVDLACGHGRNTAKLLEVSKKVIAIDVNQENVAHCLSRFAKEPRVEVIKNDGVSLRPLGAESVSLVYCFDAMVHFDSDVVREYLRDIYRVLKVGGHAFLHHSATDARPIGNFRDTPGWRNYMSVSLMTHWAHKEGLSAVASVDVDWRNDGKIKDAFTLLKKLQ